MFKNFIQKKLEKYVRMYFQKHSPKLIVVTGSVGKTTTKLAIAAVLSQKYRVRVHQGNHNTQMSVPLAILGIRYPDNIRSPLAWWKVRGAAIARVKNKTSDCDVIVQELGTEAPGEVAYFGTYLKADIAVVTAVSPAHMQFFKSLDAVAQEELSASHFSNLTFINRDDIPAEFSKYITSPQLNTYGIGGAAEYRFEVEDKQLGQFNGQLISPNMAPITARLNVSSEAGVKAAVAAALVGSSLGLRPEEISSGLGAVTSPPGRMNVLKGLKESILIDDSYNSSPLSALKAIEILFEQQTPQRILIFGDMNELGESAASEHEKLGHLCDIDIVPWVITIGPQSKQFFAPAARARGSQVRCFDDPIAAGAFAHSILEEHAVVLVKGSQNGVFAEEALKVLLHDPADQTKLVRQSQAWLSDKYKQFDKSPAV